MNTNKLARFFVLSWIALLCVSTSFASDTATTDQPWMNTSLSAEARTQLLMNAMTMDDKLVLVFGYYSSDAPWKKTLKPEGGLPQSAGYIPGIPRLNIPAQFETDAGIGVASQPGDHPTPATSLPSNLAVASSWDPELAFSGGQMIGNEARQLGFNVMLAGGINLCRESRNGRNFEYGGEDPLLAATMVASQIRGIQSNNVIATIKHYAMNDQETNRGSLNVTIDEQAARMSDLLAFQLAIEQAHPGAVMCAYNRVNGFSSCENHWLLTEILKGDWDYKGYVMSDWGAVHSTIYAANAGLDQDSGFPFDKSPYFGPALKDAIMHDYVSAARLNDMAHRILWSMFEHSLFDHPPAKGEIDFAAHALVTRTAAEQSMVLLKNDRQLLPLSNKLKSIAIIGSHADIGVLSGGGASQVYPPGGAALIEKMPDGSTRVHHASSPLEALASRTKAKLHYDSGVDINSAIKLASHSDLVIVFASQWDAEDVDNTLQLDSGYNELIAAVTKVNKNIVVVLETGGPTTMPWLKQVPAVLEAWFPGSRGGEAIARVLTGEVNPSGHLPLTFPQFAAQQPRKAVDGYPMTKQTREVHVQVNYNIEGATVGYKWFDQQHLQPLFPFGYGLSYTTFTQSLNNVVVLDNRINAQVTLKNTGQRNGKALAQIYIAPLDATIAKQWQASQRLGGFKIAELSAGDNANVDIAIDPRLVAVYDVKQKHWVIAEGDYEIRLATDANTVVGRKKVHLQQQVL